MVGLADSKKQVFHRDLLGTIDAWRTMKPSGFRGPLFHHSTSSFVFWFWGSFVCVCVWVFFPRKEAAATGGHEYCEGGRLDPPNTAPRFCSAPPLKDRRPAAGGGGCDRAEAPGAPWSSISIGWGWGWPGGAPCFLGSMG